jgi:hypothetical protein
MHQRATPNGYMTTVVAQKVTIRVRYGFGGFGVGLNVFNTAAQDISYSCTATLSGHHETELP